MAFQLKLWKKHVYDINIINSLLIIFATLGILRIVFKQPMVKHRTQGFPFSKLSDS
jgi:hypothetical protein